MSFLDLESGIPQQERQSLYLQNSRKLDDSSLQVSAGIFRITTAVTDFQHLVNRLGTHRDTIQLRDKLHKTRAHIAQLVKDTSAQLKQASETDHHAQVTVLKKISDAKLAKDFQAVLKDFQKAQRLSAERETSYAPYVPKEVLPSSYSPHEQEMSPARSPQQQSDLFESKRQELVLADHEIAFNEAVIEEREQGIQEIQQQISEVNEIFKDLAVLVHDQGGLIDDIGSNIENSHAATAQATNQLMQASKLQKSNSSLTCLLLVIFGVILMIVVIVVVA